MKSHTILMSLVLFGACLSRAQYDSAGPHKPRNLDAYETTGPFQFTRPPSAPESMPMEAAIREFIWRHWHEQRLGYLRATYVSREGEKSEVGYFVERSQRGIWYVAVEIDRELRNPKGGFMHRSDGYVATIVERAELEKDGMTPLRPIPPAEERDRNSYQLALRDESGKILTTL